MKARIPYDYYARYVLERGRNHRDAFQVSAVEVDIPELETGDVRLAFELSNAYVPQHELENGVKPKFSRRADGGLGRVYAHGGHLWTEWCPATEVEALAHLGHNENNPFSVWTKRDGSISYLGFDSGKKVETQEMVEKEHKKKCRTWTDDGGREIAALIRVRAGNDMVVIDGMLCVKTAEPCLVAVSTHGKHPAVVLAIEESGPCPGSDFTGRDRNPDRGMRWRLDRYDEALAGAKALAEYGGVEFRSQAEVGICDKAFIRFADDEEAVVAAANGVASNVGRVLPSVASDVGLAWYPLQDAVDAAPGRASPAVVEALCWMAESLAKYPEINLRAAMDQLRHTGDQVENVKSSIAWFTTMARIAVYRWNARPQDGLEWIALGMAPHSSLTRDGETYEILTAAAADQVGRALGMDMSPFAERAARGEGHIVAVKTDGNVSGAAFCRSDGERYQVLESFGPNGRALSPKAERCLDAHIAEATKALGDTMALAEMTF
jgi:hypothetical protein